MSKYLKGFIIGMFVIVVGFVLTVLIMASVNNRSFTEEIKSWGETEQSTEIPDNVIEDDLTGEEDTEGEETNADEGTDTETQAVITLFNGNINLKIA